VPPLEQHKFCTPLESGAERTVGVNAPGTELHAAEVLGCVEWFVRLHVGGLPGERRDFYPGGDSLRYRETSADQTLGTGILFC
jgi:hypothetical protein